MSLIGSILAPMRPSNPPPPSGGSTGASGGNGTGQADGSGAGGAGAVTEPAPGATNNDTNGSGTNTGSGTDTGTGTRNTSTNPASGRGKADPLPPKGPATDRPPAAEPEKGALEKFLSESYITDSERLELAFATSLDEALARRYAEAARLTVITEAQLARMREGVPATDLGRDAGTIRDLEAPAREDRYDRAA